MKSRLPTMAISRLRQGGAHTVKKYDRTAAKRMTMLRIQEWKEDEADSSA